ncbi:MAG: hypothetical protein ACT4O1_12295 [Gemmatimonadota bacterium]
MDATHPDLSPGTHVAATTAGSGAASGLEILLSTATAMPRYR